MLSSHSILSGLLEECFEIAQEIRALNQEDVPMPFKPIFDRLSELRATLERLSLTHRWSLRETDLYK
jgi:NTP pyrophosphatase (non-canonical NTP hydrolase)